MIIIGIIIIKMVKSEDLMRIRSDRILFELLYGVSRIGTKKVIVK